jgi:hypothetical protein
METSEMHARSSFLHGKWVMAQQTVYRSLINTSLPSRNTLLKTPEKDPTDYTVSYIQRGRITHCDSSWYAMVLSTGTSVYPELCCT